MAALRSGLKCSRTACNAPRLNRIDALPLNVIYNFKIASSLNKDRSFDNQGYRGRTEGEKTADRTWNAHQTNSGSGAGIDF